MKKIAKTFILLLIVAIAGVGVWFATPRIYELVHKDNSGKTSFFKPKQDGPTSISQKDPIWDKNVKKDTTIDIKCPDCEGNYSIFIPKDKEKDIELQHDGKTAGVLFEGEYRPDSITGIKLTDVNFDGNSDILMSVTIFGEERALLSLCYDGELSADNSCFYSKELSSKDNLKTSFTVDEMAKKLTGGRENGDFKSYKDGYEAVVDYYEFLNKDSSEDDWLHYDLIYFDDDKIPELGVQYIGGYYLYSFKDGSIQALMHDSSFGDYKSFGYAPKENSLRIHDIDEQTNEYIFKSVNDGSMQMMYGRDFKDKSDCENFSDEKLSDKELKSKVKELSDLEYEDLEGEYVASQIKKKLGI